MIIGISGGTGSGKTTVANRILESVSAKDVVFIQQDSYYRNLTDLPLDYRGVAKFLEFLAKAFVLPAKLIALGEELLGIGGRFHGRSRVTAAMPRARHFGCIHLSDSREENFRMGLLFGKRIACLTSRIFSATHLNNAHERFRPMR